MTSSKGSSYRCSFPSCTQRFGRKTDCMRHESEKHGPLKSCPEPSCTYTSKRGARVTAHTERKHGYRHGDGGVPLIVLDNFQSTSPPSVTQSGGTVSQASTTEASNHIYAQYSAAPTSQATSTMHNPTLPTGYTSTAPQAQSYNCPSSYNVSSAMSQEHPGYTMTDSPMSMSNNGAQALPWMQYPQNRYHQASWINYM